MALNLAEAHIISKGNSFYQAQAFPENVMNFIDRRFSRLSVVDILLADVALRIQLSPTQYGLATERYETIHKWLEREGSPLANLVARLYAQGSMSIGATIFSSMDDEDFDIDVIVELLVDADTPPDVVLDIFFLAVKGEKGSRYYDKVERNTRCVTVHYEDMHIDLTPVVIVPERPARSSWIYHHKQDDPSAPAGRYLANPWGFANYYRENTPLDHDFAEAFASFAEGRSGYDMIATAKAADAEPVPELEPITQKSRALVVHQLTKRWRNNRFSKRKGARRPPSPLLACVNAQSAGQTETLAEELHFQIECLLSRFEAAQVQGRRIHVVNPRCEDDVFSDRWPADLRDQVEFIEDLRDFRDKAWLLRQDIDLPEMQRIMIDLFGEKPTTTAFENYLERQGQAVQGGRTIIGDGGRIDPVRSGLLGSSAAAAAPNQSAAKTTPGHRFFGAAWKGQ